HERERPPRIRRIDMCPVECELARPVPERVVLVDPAPEVVPDRSDRKGEDREREERQEPALAERERGVPRHLERRAGMGLRRIASDRPVARPRRTRLRWRRRWDLEPCRFLAVLALCGHRGALAPSARSPATLWRRRRRRFSCSSPRIVKIDS